MTERPERLDIQVRQARARRNAKRDGLAGGMLFAVAMVGIRWYTHGWRWYYLLLLPFIVVIALWISRLSADSDEELTRWFWRAPR